MKVYNLESLKELNSCYDELGVIAYYRVRDYWFDKNGKRMFENTIIQHLNIGIVLPSNDTIDFKEIQLNSEMVDHPDHYGGKDNIYEAIKVIEAWELDFHLGNVVKYISRAGKKDDELQELKKSRWYLDRKIQNLENNNQNA